MYVKASNIKAFMFYNYFNMYLFTLFFLPSYFMVIAMRQNEIINSYDKTKENK